MLHLPKMRPCILATGGCGYIGSHVVVELVAAGYQVVILDNFENSTHKTAARIKRLCKRHVTIVEGDVRDRALVEDTLLQYNVNAVIHLAGKKAVGESVADPILYFHDNLLGAIALLEAMRNCDVGRIVFSSSATVYGASEMQPLAETASTCVLNPYGRTKLMIEEMIDDVTASAQDFKAVSLRYFNPVGAHPSGQIGENPTDVPNNLFPYVSQTAAGIRDKVRVFGGDYETPDGTGVRDYIHVVDLAKGHVAALDYLFSDHAARHERINLGTGTGYSVLEVIEAFSKASGTRVAYEIVARRPGDVAVSLADATFAKTLLGWEATHNLTRMCKDHWAFQCGGKPDEKDSSFTRQLHFSENVLSGS